MINKFTSLSANPVLFRRAAYIAVITFCIAVTLALAGKLADVVSHHVDLLDLRAASTVMQYQIITTGQRLWHSGIDAGLFESYVLSEMTALNTARAGLLADICKDGHIYAR